ncbi:MAG: hypothetical protein PF542_00715 [Nanoarchaeota archaeon]|jgi:hypothetical protein|nr:hypothetical protein [Nanoarchaeota archaeon]
MDLEVLSHSETMRLSPKTKTIVFRFGDDKKLYEFFKPDRSDNLIGIKDYIYDFVDSGNSNNYLNVKHFDNELAEKILFDLEEYISGIDKLVISSERGQSSAPAVAMFINDIFGLGYDNLKSYFPKANKDIYRIGMEAWDRRTFQEWWGEICERDKYFSLEK